MYGGATVRLNPRSTLLATLVLSCAAVPAWGQYKIVAPDGRVTYTDRPPADASARVTELGRRTPAAEPAPTAVLPADLRQLVERFPVTLFTAADCAPCDRGRELLRQRGIPYRERSIVSNDDVAALERTVGGRTVPSLTVGGQALQGYSQGDWTSYLDAAGYPRESRLPSAWTAPPVTALVPRPATPVDPQAALVPPPAPPTPTVVQPAPGSDGPSGIRF
jgi:glutaredoxin